MSLKNAYNEIKNYLALKPYSDQTRINYGYQLRRFYKWCSIRKIPLRKFTPGVFLQYSSEQGWTEGSEMQNQAHNSIRGFLRWKLGKKQPLEGLELRRLRAGPQRTLSPGERDQIFASLLNRSRKALSPAVRDCAIRNIAMLSLALDTGLRSNEICNLKMSGLDLENQVLHVVGKGGYWRHPVFSDITEERLQQWLIVRAKRVKQGIDNVFIGVSGCKAGREMTRAGLRDMTYSIAKVAGVKRFSPHALRRSMATISLRNGASIRIVQVQGGWATPYMVERYTRAILPEDIAPFFATSSMCSCRAQKGIPSFHAL